jgi:LL-diaminopimelate aminotransferase
MVPLCFVNPGDVVLQTVPGYPVMATHSKYVGGRVVNVPLKKENGFMPDLAAIPAEMLDQAKLFYINYPNNPTGAAPTPAFYDALIALAKKHKFLIVQDAAYATLVYGDHNPSILARPGGLDVAVELHSMSKSYNMTGWRLGFFAGHPAAVNAMATVKDNIDSGQFKAIQLAACAGIADKALADSIREHYHRRLQKLVKVLQNAGFDAAMPGGTFFLYTQAPKSGGGKEFKTAEDASQYLIREQSVSTVPWDDVGNFLRFSSTFESAGPADDDRVLAELAWRLEKAQLKF